MTCCPIGQQNSFYFLPFMPYLKQKYPGEKFNILMDILKNEYCVSSVVIPLMISLNISKEEVEGKAPTQLLKNVKEELGAWYEIMKKHTKLKDTQSHEG